MKIDIFSGFLGAGKTTLIKKLIKEAYAGEKVVLIENEFGEIGVDGGFMQDAGINVTEMNSGCICCSLVGDFSKALQQVEKEYAPERIIIEPSGVGKLSDVIKAVANANLQKGELNAFCTVVDAAKCKMYMKNFGEFFNDQVENAGCIILSHTDKLSAEKLQTAVDMLREKNGTATIVTAPWDNLSGKAILAAMEQKDSLEAELARLKEEHERHEHHHHHHGEDCDCGCHEHHHHHDEDCDCGCHEHHHHHDEDCDCGCHEHHHHHDEDCDCGCHEHHHHHDEDCDCGCHEHHHHHDEDCDCGCHEHHHHHHDEDCDCGCHEHHHHHDEDCDCGCHEHHHHHHEHHHHHHADEVFTSWGKETARVYTEEEITHVLHALEEEEKYGKILRAKGIVAGNEGWIHFDYVPGEGDVRKGSAGVTGRLCVIGCDIKEDALQALFKL